MKKQPKTVKCSICGKRRKAPVGAVQAMFMSPDIEIMLRPHNIICDKCCQNLFKIITKPIMDYLNLFHNKNYILNKLNK